MIDFLNQSSGINIDVLSEMSISENCKEDCNMSTLLERMFTDP